MALWEFDVWVKTLCVMFTCKQFFELLRKAMRNTAIVALYCFTHLEDLNVIQRSLFDACEKYKMRGSIIIAHEGINGTIFGNRKDINVIIELIQSICGKNSLNTKISFYEEKPFSRMKVRQKKEIITMGLSSDYFSDSPGHYVDPKDWNELVNREDVVIIDTRNSYEIDIGTFKNSINPKIDTFSDFPAWWAQNKPKFLGKSVAMFCTGGIRCEKSTKFIKNDGINDVFHLRGGILNYLNEIPIENSLWQGECFVFDQRVSVTHGMSKGENLLCFACRHPLLPIEMKLSNYEEGVSCHRCYQTHSDDRRARFRERQKQILLKANRKSNVRLSRSRRL